MSVFQILFCESSQKLATLFFQALPAGLTLSMQQAMNIERRAWMIWALWWLAMAFFSKSTKRRESPIERMEHLVPAILGFALIFRAGFAGAWLARPLFVGGPTLRLGSVAVTILGLLFALWARLALGANWSGSVTIKTNHQLIRRGPYRSIRHPIYTGMLAALLATAVTQGRWSGAVGFALVFLALFRKARREELFLSQEFGEGFAEHREHTGMFLPRFS